MSNPTKTSPRKFLKNSAVLAVGDLLTKGARIVLVPYYVRVLTTPEVGQLAILLAVLYASWALCALGLGFAVKRYYQDYQDNAELNGDAFTATLWWGRMLAALPIYLLLLATAQVVASLSQQPGLFGLLAIAITAGYLKAGYNIVEARYLIREEPYKYRLFTFLQFATSLVLIIYFVSRCGMGVEGVLWGELACHAVWTVISAVLLRCGGLPKLSSVRWSECLSYCLPAVPHFLFMWGLASVDRLVLTGYVSDAQIGIYDIGYLLASGLSIISLALRSAWMPSFFRSANQEDGKQHFVQTANLYLFLVAFVALVAFASADILVPIIASASFGESVDVFRVALGGSLLLALFIAMNQPLFLERKIGLLAAISGAGLLANFVSNVILIPQLGIMGAAWSTVIAYATVTVLVFFAVRSVYRVTWEAGYVLKILLLTTVLAAGCELLAPDASSPGQLVLRVAIVAAFPLICLAAFPTQLRHILHSKASPVSKPTEQAQA